MAKEVLKPDFLKIDGSMGEGGGQILRTALSLSMITNTPIHLFNIRAGRKKSGLMRQHLVCVNSSRELCNAVVVGNEIGSTEIYFSPKKINETDRLELNIGSAGSTTLVLQTLLPVLLLQNKTTTLTIKGGTHNPLAPTADFIHRCFIPALNKMGIHIDFELIHAGFAPVGGGEIKAVIHAWDNPLPIHLTKTEQLHQINAYAGCLNLDSTIASRELSVLAQELTLSHANNYHLTGISQGNSVFVEMVFDNHRQVISALGEIKKSAEKVAKNLAKTVKTYLDSSAIADEYLTDQLLLPMALCAINTGNSSQFTAEVISEHSKTQAMMIEKFLSVAINFIEQDKHFLVVVDKI